MRGLRDLRVVDFSSEIAGPYCSKLFADAGAEVVKIEPPEGDPMRRWSASGAALGAEDGALFGFLAASKRSWLGALGEREVDALVADADLVIEDFPPALAGSPGARAREAARSAQPELCWLSITPWGQRGPWASRPASEFVVQAECGSIGSRGLPGREPFQAGGRITEWVAGTFAAAAALAAVLGARRSGRGEWIDFSWLEAMTYASSNFADLMCRVVGIKELRGRGQSVETPSVEPTADGFVGFCTNTAQQFSDFLLLIERPELREDAQLFQIPGRMARFDEWNEIVRDFTRAHTTAEVVERASLLRIPVSPVNDGDTVQQHEQLVARGVFRSDPTGRCEVPRPPYRIDGELPPAPRPAPALGEANGRFAPRAAQRDCGQEALRLPLEGLRILDLTCWWAGPSATHMLATLGADVIHIESVQHMDGMRTTGGAMRGRADAWWEFSGFYLAANANKRGLTLNLADPRGVALAKRLIGASDALVENYTPRVLEGFGLDWDAFHAINPRGILVRMPAFGLSGPWRDHPGFAQTMEQMTGMAWLTGHPDDQPRIQRGPCDPLAGMHAAFALLVALEERRQTGRGAQVEVTMVEGALNAAAEALIEFTAYGARLGREGNRSPRAAPQGLYGCAGSRPGREAWLALSVETDAQWAGLIEVLGNPAWAADPRFAHHAGRRAAHDALDAHLRSGLADRALEPLVEALVAAGVPAGRVSDPRTTSRHPQLEALGFFEEIDHPIVGRHPIPTVPFRYQGVERWLRRPAPTLGQHNREILRDLLSLSDAEIDALEAADVIGTRPVGA